MASVFFTKPRFHSWIKVTFHHVEVTAMNFHTLNNRTGNNNVKNTRCTNGLPEIIHKEPKDNKMK